MVLPFTKVKWLVNKSEFLRKKVLYLNKNTHVLPVSNL